MMLNEPLRHRRYQGDENNVFPLQQHGESQFDPVQVAIAFGNIPIIKSPLSEAPVRRYVYGYTNTLGAK